MVVVSDTTPLSNFLQINRLDLLKDLYQSVVIAPAIFSELTALEKLGVSIESIREANWITVKAPSNTLLVKELQINLDVGEAEAIALAVESQPDFLLIDEIQGRISAKNYHLPIIGTLGILLQAKQAGLLKEIKAEIDKLLIIGFWIDDGLYRKVLKTANET